MTPEDQARARADAMRVRVRVADDRAAMRLTAPMMRLHADRLREVLDDEDWLLDRLAAETAEVERVRKLGPRQSWIDRIDRAGEAYAALLGERDDLRAENEDLRRGGAQARRDGFSQGRAAGEAAAVAAERREAELRARIVAVCDEHQCDETCELIDCEQTAGYWVSIERVRAVLFPAEEAPSE